MAQRTAIFYKIIGFILSPFVEIIRYGALKLMKRMGHHGDERVVIAVSDHLLNTIILPSVFRFFQDEDFREAANFKEISAVEHDRIFNELEVAGIC